MLRAPAAGTWHAGKKIGDLVNVNDVLGRVDEYPVYSGIPGMIRGLIRDGTPVGKGAKLGDVDPRGEKDYCDTISDKARTIGGAVLRVILNHYNR